MENNGKNNDKKSILLHTCCAPCSVMCVEKLKEDGFDPTAFFFNPNIHPFSEYKNRLFTLKEFCAASDIPLIALKSEGSYAFSSDNENSSAKTASDASATHQSESSYGFISDENISLFTKTAYGLRGFLSAIPNHDFPSRCAVCYRIRLDETARYAKQNGYDRFSTTLLISPYQNHELLIKTAETAAEKYQIPFLYRDFREFFREGQSKARAAGFYMQKYCGCIFSEYENTR
jgi:predicted adenine nucleotide alpha hydrolase (AANH) superfamily ATPase